MRPLLTWPGHRLRGGSSDERGQSTVEYILVLVLISVPISLMMLKFLQMVISVVVSAIVGDFTEGHM